jgi:short subunit dehydrogenase-like uncharacterized protein
VSSQRQLDIVLFGATSFVGRLCAQYLARVAPQQARIALAGRSHERLAQLQASLGAPAASWPLLVADTNDANSVTELARVTRVLASTVGPYRRYGMPVLEACARLGTHYADLTGEVLFMRDAIDRFNDIAQSSGARIVHSCGFDSIPSDLGVLQLHEAVTAEGDGQLQDTVLVVRAMKGGPSGGTVASLKGTVDDARSDPKLAKLLADPHALSPNRAAEPNLGPERDQRGVQHDQQLRMWLAPFIMGSINTRVVRRSNALLDHAYGPNFRYREVMGFPSGPLGALQATAVASGVSALAVGLSVAPTRAVLNRLLPDPGDGPSESQRDAGFFSIDIHTRTSTGAHYRCRIAAQGDPGYKATAVMFSEASLSLALDGLSLPLRAGVLTPATAIGDPLVKRLQLAGQTFEVQRVG